MTKYKLHIPITRVKEKREEKDYEKDFEVADFMYGLVTCFISLWEFKGIR